MEVVNGNVAMLANFEVYDFLKSDQDTKNSQELATITYETKKYLSSSPSAHQSSEGVIKFMTALEKYNLTKAEKLQLLNIRPTQPVEMQLLIEEIEERFDDNEISELIDIITEHLPLANENNDMMINDTHEH